jgi:hypothetical protein
MRYAYTPAPCRVRSFLCIFVLRVDICETGLDCVQFVASDSPVQDFKAAGRGIELPAGLLAQQWNRERKIIIADDKHAFLVALELDRMPGIVGDRKSLARLGVGDIVAGRDDVPAAGAEHPQNVHSDAGFDRGGQCARRFLWRRERSLRICGWYRQGQNDGHC